MIDPLVIAAIALSSLYFVMVLYFFVGWLRLKKPETETKTADSDLPFVSIVIPVRNESLYIKDCLQSVFAQKYPLQLFEVIVIDDYSTDPTLRFARELERPNLLVLDLQQYLGDPGEYVPNKKKAIALGIKNAQGELIITTDGDCVMGENWLKSMVACYTNNNYKLISGPVMIRPARNPLAWLQQLDVINMLGITGATMRNAFPLMCNGANLMYAKKTFWDVEGFKGNHDVPTGDDIFLMHKINERYPGAVGFVKDYEACVFTKSEKGLGSFISQRIRWVSKSRSTGDFRVTLMLIFAYFFNLFVLLSPFALLRPVTFNWLPLAISGGAKLIIDFIFDVPLTYFFRRMVLLLFLPFAEIFHLLYVMLIGALSLLGRYRWKDRLVK